MMRWVFFAAAIIIRLSTYWLSPVHELGHVILATVQDQTVTDWDINRVMVVGLNDVTQHGAYFMELGFYTIVAMLFAGNWVGMFALGVDMSLVIRALDSTDLEGADATKTTFVLLWMVAIVLCWVALVRREKRRADEQPATG